MRVDDQGNLIIVAFEDIETKEVYGFTGKNPLESIEQKQALEAISKGCIVRNIVENVYDGDLVLVLGEDEQLLFFYKFSKQQEEKVIIYTESDLQVTEEFESFEAECPELEFTTLSTSFGPNPFRLRDAETSIIDSNLLSSFLETQTLSPRDNDSISLPADATTGSKKTNVVIRFSSFVKTPVNSSKQTISDVIINEVSSDLRKFKNNLGPLISKHYVAVKQSDQRWELRLVARPPYPYHEEFVKLFIFESEGIQTQLMRTIVSTQSPDVPLRLEEVYAAGLYNEISNVPSLAFALNALIQDDSLSIKCELISKGESIDKFKIMMSFADIGSSPLIMMMGLNLKNQAEEDKTSFERQAILLLRTIVNIANSAAKSSLDEAASDIKETLIIDKTVKAYQEIESQLAAVRSALDLKSTPNPESRKEFPRIALVDYVSKDIVPTRSKTLLKFVLDVSVFTISYDGSKSKQYGTNKKIPFQEFRTGTRYPYFFNKVDTDNSKFDFDELNENVGKPIIFAETLTFSYFDESAFENNIFLRSLFEGAVLENSIGPPPENFAVNYPTLRSATGILHLDSFDATIIKYYTDQMQEWAKSQEYQILMQVQYDNEGKATISIKLFSSPNYLFANLSAGTLQEALNEQLDKMMKAAAAE